jgi:GntR family transcriptional regulator
MINHGRIALAANISAAPHPLYLQVYDMITDAIKTGQLKPGDRLPTERSFCQQFGVSRATVRRALRRLVDEGVVEATVGRGSFISGGPLVEPPNALLSFTELAAARGLVPSARVLSQQLRQATVEEAGLFGGGVHELVFELERLRLLDLTPVALDRTRVPISIAPSLTSMDFTDASIYAALDEAGAAPMVADVVVSAVAAGDAEGETLGVPAGEPLIVCTTMSHDGRNRLVEIAEITYRADRYRFRATLTRQRRDPAAG